jgi:hypothetical protein
MPGGHTVGAPSAARIFLRLVDQKFYGKYLGIVAGRVLAHPESRENNLQPKVGLKRIILRLSWLDNPGEKKLKEREGAR